MAKNVSKHALTIVLIEPKIPQNTGSIARLCASNFWKLILVKPLGFSLEDKYLKRSGLDYWPFVEMQTLDSVEKLKEYMKPFRKHILSTKGTLNYTKRQYQKQDLLIFGNEPKGFPDGFLKEYTDDLATIPMASEHVRSLNLAMAVGIVAYEATRQIQLGHSA